MNTKCPRGLLAVDARAHMMAEHLQCPKCGGFHKEDQKAELQAQEEERQLKREKDLNVLADALLIIIAKSVDTITTAEAKAIAVSLTPAVYSMGARP